MKEQKQTLLQVVRTVGDNALLKALLQRRADDLDALDAILWTGATVSALTLHLSRASALENARICLHPLYGFSYLPGSGLKGVARAYAETVWLTAQDHSVATWRAIETVFGWAPNSDRGKENWKPPQVPDRAKDEAAHIGALVFHDAWPQAWPRLSVGIANNHHAQYYVFGSGTLLGSSVLVLQLDFMGFDSSPPVALYGALLVAAPV